MTERTQQCSARLDDPASPRLERGSAVYNPTTLGARSTHPALNATVGETERDSIAELAAGATVLVTGGAGFIGSCLAVELRRAGAARVVAIDSLRRPGSELNIRKLRDAGVEIARADVRVRDDLEPFAPDLSLIVDCAADPSVLAGYSTPASSVVGHNLTGTVNCLELARRTGASFVFCSTSRIYPIARLNGLRSVELASRYELSNVETCEGVSDQGISEAFPLSGGTRSLYGATKLASEMLIQEYAAMFGFKHVINRFGVVSGPGQMGQVEQGVFTLWLARHHFGGHLSYRGWGGRGKQVRDLLHVDDVAELVLAQLRRWDRVNGRTYNVGGGRANSISLAETSALCRELTGTTLSIGSEPETHPADVRFYYTDHRRISEDVGWAPGRSVRSIFEDTLQWLREQEVALRPLFTR